MKFTSLAAGAVLAGSVIAAPAGIQKRQNIDSTVLQFALTLEHLENAFYHGALANFTQQDFMDAGYSDTYYNNVKYIAHDEEQHVTLLSGALTAAGYAPVAACTYSFGYTDVRSFITLSSVLEGVGTSAYLGGAPLITSKGYLTVAGSILVTEALHTSLQRGAIGEVPMANPYGTPLDPTSVYTLAAAFIVSCPSTNAALPFTPFPALSYDSDSCTCEEPSCAPANILRRGVSCKPGSWQKPGDKGPMPAGYCAAPMAGATITLETATAISGTFYVTFVSGLSVVSVEGTCSGTSVTVVIPAVCMGQTYVFITKSDVETTFDDSQVLFGPTIVEVSPPAVTLDYTVV